MNFLATAPDGLVWVLAFLLIAAAAEDALRMRISNIACLAVIVTAIAAMVAHGFASYMWENAVIFASLLAAGTLLFATGKFGGGDVKLLAALGLWVNFRAAPALFANILIAGGLLALLILASRAMAPAGAGQRFAVLKPNAGIPYGIAIAAGALVTLLLNRT